MHDQGSNDRVLQVGPNAVLTRQGLMVDGHRSALRHITDLATVVLQTSSVVATLLAGLFPVLSARPGEDGDVIPSDEDAWSQYSRHALLLAGATEEAQRQTAGRAVIRWCLLAHAMVTLTGHPAGDTPAFLAVQLLVDQGGRALTVTPSTWRAHVEHEVVQRSLAATIARLNGTGGDAPDPRGAPAMVAIPWLEDLGVDLGGDARYLGHVCELVTDLHLRPRVSVVELGRGHWMPLRASAAPAFVQAFQAACQGPAHHDVGVTLTHDRGTARFRSVRFDVPATATDPAGSFYVFRRLVATRWSLGDLGLSIGPTAIPA